MRMAAVSVVKGLVIVIALAVTGACGPRKAALGSSGGSSSSGGSGSGSSSGAGQTGAGTSGTSGTTGSAASSDTGTAGATTGEPYMGPYHPCTKDEDCDDVAVDGVSGRCDIRPEGSICIPPYECVPWGDETGGEEGIAVCPDLETLECTEDAKSDPEYKACAFGGSGSRCSVGPPIGNVCEISCSPPQYPCPGPLVCAILFDDWGRCVWPP